MAAAVVTPPPPSAAATKSTALTAATALLKWRAANSSAAKPDLLDSSGDDFLYLVVSLKHIPLKSRVNAFKLPLPTPLHSPAATEFCLIFDDRPTSTLTKPQIKSKIADDSLPIAKIIKLSKLKSDYKPFEAKRKLLNSYDIFLADKRIVPLLPRLLGKHFFKRKRIPVPIDLTKKNWKEQVERICGSAMMYLSTGSCCVVRVARCAMSEEDIAGNVAAAVEGVVGIVDGGWGGVRSLHLKLLESIALPLYQTVPDEAKEKKVEVVIEKAVEEEEEEESKWSEKKKGKKKGMIQEVRNLDSVVGEAKSGKRKKEAIGKVGENDEVDGGEVRKSKRIKEKDVPVKEVKKAKEVAEKPTRKVKGEVGLVELKKSLKAKSEMLNVEKPVKKAVKAKDEVVVVVGKNKSDVLPVKDKKKDVLKKGDELSGKGGEAIGKEKRKSEPVKLKSEEAKPKTAKRSKK